MTPVTFGDNFGWLHTPRGGVGRVAVLICQALMQDALLSHCSLRLLADQLAQAGYWVLRFDYPGTGDSRSEGDAEPVGGYWQAWQNSIDRAAGWLMDKSGASQLVLCGLRSGATLAALAAARRPDVAGLIQFAPVVRGSSYVRQLLVQAELQAGQPLPAEAGLTFYEFHFSRATLDDVRRVDLRRLQLREGQKVAVFPRGPSRLADECMAAWRAAGVAVTRGCFDKLEPMLRHNIIDENSLADFSDVLAWLGRNFPYGGTGKAVVPKAGPVVLRPPGCVEVPLRFGKGARLFGMLCRPERNESDLAVVITNSGRDPHYGSCRQSVSLARQLAQVGIASLRLDFAGLGDSLGPAGKENVLSHMFEADRYPDIKAALDELERLGFRRFALQGLCAGAYHSLRSALADPRISALLLVNIPLFSLTGEVLDYLQWRGSSLAHYAGRLLTVSGWRSLLGGKVNVSSILRGQFAQVQVRVSARMHGLAGKFGLVERQTVAHRAMATLSARGVRTLFLFSPGQSEIDAFAQEFGRRGEKLAAYPGAEMEIVPNMDHDMGGAAGRRLAQARMVEFMTAEPRAPAVPVSGEHEQRDTALAA